MKIQDVLRAKIKVFPEPILSPGEGRAWDNKGAMTPSPWQNDFGEFFMHYIGQSYQSDHWKLGLARSVDLLDWQKSEINPLVDFGILNLDHTYIDCPSLIKYGNRVCIFYEGKKNTLIRKNLAKSIIKQNVVCCLPVSMRRNLIRMKRDFFDRKGISLALQHAQDRSIYMATLNDCLDFSKLSPQEVFLAGNAGTWDSKGVFSPRAFCFKNQYFLLYGGSDGERVRSGFAVSQDMLHWQRRSHSPFLDVGEHGQWDENHALVVDILELEDGYCGFYEGEDTKNRFRIGIATSKDLIHWEKFKGNPILDIGPKGSFKERMVCGPRVLVKDGKIYLFHAAHNAWMTGFCGLAVLENDRAS